MRFAILMTFLVAGICTVLGETTRLVGATANEWPFHSELNGTMMAYDFDNTDMNVPWGKDMKPVFVNYIARHGARFLSSEKKIDKLQKELDKARESGNISKAGEDFQLLIQLVDSVTDGNWGRLNAVGICEEQTLGKEMYQLVPALLKEGKVEARATYVPRVVMSMYELCHELACQTADIEITTMEGSQFNRLLRYFKTDSTYVDYIDNGPWKSSYDEYAKAVTPCSPAAKLFLNPPDDEKLRKLTLDMYDILQSLQASELSVQAGEWFSEKEFEACWRVDNLKHYYQRSANPFSDMAAKAAIPLLKDIIGAADNAISGKDNLSASLRFGHAESVIPLFSLMRLPGCYAPECTPEEVAKEWKDYDISPLGANLLIVALRDSGGESYVALRLNGQWIAMGGEKIIRWDKLKAEWLSYMED